MDNKEIRQRMKGSGVKQWQLADKLGISEATLVRWLRKNELPEDVQQKVLEILSRTEGR